MNIGGLGSPVRRLSTKALNLLAPQRCIYCDQTTDRIEAICRFCCIAVQPNRTPCPRCALPDCRGSLCPACQTRLPALQSVTAPYRYDVAVAYLVSLWKYRGERRLSDTIARLMLQETDLRSDSDILLPTPLHWRRQLRRGFNQSDDLLRSLCAVQPQLKMACAHRVRLSRQRSVSPQASSSRRERLRNLRGAFKVSGDLKGRSVTIIDDVCTTGATGNAIAATLLDAGAREVHLWCFTRTPAR
ncbi:MAG: ComF family protein [Halieaceae bacterium]|jgi:ComF family protein